MEHQQCEIRGGDTTDPACLAKIGGPDPAKLLTSLVAKLRDGVVVKRDSDRHVFDLLLLSYRGLLAAEITRILGFNLNLAGGQRFDLRIRQLGRQITQPRPVDLGTTQDFLQ